MYAIGCGGLVAPALGILLTAIVLELVEEGRLAARRDVARVLTLDSVHLAEYLRARCERERIPAVIRAYHFRRLLHFFGPLFKMALLVPEAERERAEALVEETRAPIVGRAPGTMGV